MTDLKRCLGVVVAGMLACGFTAAARAQSVRFEINASGPTKPISPYIYGRNNHEQLDGQWDNQRMTRLGGNRYTAWNWVTNDSNAGADYHHQNDGHMGPRQTGYPVRNVVQRSGMTNAATLITVPMAGYVAADRNGGGASGGDVALSPNFLQTRFRESLPRKNAAFSLTPGFSNTRVYQDEFVHWVENVARQNPSQPIWYALDNEPDLWAETHPRLRQHLSNPRTTYTELRDRTVAYAGAIKDVAPGTIVFGAVNYGWGGYRNLQQAPDAASHQPTDFHQWFLSRMNQAHQQHGRRLVDALAIHYYSEARDANNVRIIGGSQSNPTRQSIDTRVQAARSLYDPTYVENSWITRDSLRGAAINLLPRTLGDIEAFYPGTKLAITEYGFGGAEHISGAESLGAFGSHGVFAASWWLGDPAGPSFRYVRGAMDMYLSFDGQGGRFGDLSIGASTSDISRSAIFASRDSRDPSRIVLIAINRTAGALGAMIDLNLAGLMSQAPVYQLTSAGPAPVYAGSLSISGSGFDYTMPAYSVSTIVLTVPEPAAMGSILGAGALLLQRRRAGVRGDRP